jgi:lysyl-tRNA synthetase class II
MSEKPEEVPKAEQEISDKHA